jgi:hypothetical protein
MPRLRRSRCLVVPRFPDHRPDLHSSHRLRRVAATEEHQAARYRWVVEPLRFAITSRPRCDEDLHLQAVVHARHTKKKGEEPKPFPFHKRKSCGSTAVLASVGSARNNGQRLGGFELFGLLEFLCHEFILLFLSARCGRTLHTMHIAGHAFQRKKLFALSLEVRGIDGLNRISGAVGTGSLR